MADRKAMIRTFAEEVWNRKNLGHVDRNVTDDFMAHDPFTGDGDADTYKRQIGAYHEAFPDVKMEVQQVIAEGDMAALRWKTTGTHRKTFLGIEPTNKRVTIEGVTVLRFEGDRVAEEWDRYDGLSLLRQIGGVKMPQMASSDAWASQPRA